METPRFSVQSERVFATAKEEAKKMKSDNVSAGHILLALMLEGKGCACEALKIAEFNIEMVRYFLLLKKQKNGRINSIKRDPKTS